MTLNLMVSGILGILLVAMIASAWLLGRRLKALRDGSGDLKILIDGLNAATVKAQASIAGLKVTSKELEADWADSITKARALADELALITHAGENLAERLEERLIGGPAALVQRAAEPAMPPASPQQNDVVRALRGVR